MGSGLGLLQSKILVMANINRSVVGMDTRKPSVCLEQEVDRPALNGYFATLHALRDKLSRLYIKACIDRRFDRGDVRYVHNALVETLLAKAGEGGAGNSGPTVHERFEEAALFARRALKKIAVRHGIECAEKLWLDGEQGAYRVEVSEHATVKEADEARQDLVAKGVPGDNVRVYLPAGADHLRSTEILADAYGFRRFLLDDRNLDRRRLPWGILFDRQAIGEARYNAACVAVRKAVRSLWVHNLVAPSDKIPICKGGNEWGGNLSITLTPEGIEKAEDVLAKMPDITSDLSLYRMTTGPGPGRDAPSEE